MSALFTDLYKEERITAKGYANGIYSLFTSVQIQAQIVNPFKPRNMFIEFRYFQNAYFSKFISCTFNTERKVKLSP